MQNDLTIHTAPPAPPLAFEAAGHSPKPTHNSGALDKSNDLKALASLVLKRGSERGSNGALVKNGAPLASQLASGEWGASEWQAFFHERAGIAEYDGDLSRIDAESVAYRHCIVRWLNINPSPHIDANTCPQCGGATNDKSLAVLNAKGGHLWLHDKCHQPWLDSRKKAAISALALLVLYKNDE